jgi:hypothetical protein
VDDRELRVVSDLNTSYLSVEALANIERLAIELADGAPLRVCDRDANGSGNSTWLVAEGVAQLRSRAARMADRVHDGRRSLGASRRLRLGWASVRECHPSAAIPLPRTSEAGRRS